MKVVQKSEANPNCRQYGTNSDNVDSEKHERPYIFRVSISNEIMYGIWLMAGDSTFCGFCEGI